MGENKKKFGIFRGGVVAVLVIVGLIIGIGFQSFMEYVDNTEYAIHQNAFTGELTVWNDAGWHVQMFGKVVKFPKAGDIYLSADDLDGGSGKDVQPVSVLFPDGNAKVDVVSRYELSLIDSIQMDLYVKYGNPEAVHNMIRQQIIEAVKGVGPLMSSAEAYSDRKPEFAILARSMSLEGIYASNVNKDTTYDKDSNVVVVKSYDVKKENGRPIITKGSILKEYNMTLPIFNVKDMDFDDKTVALIEARKEAQKAKQDAITAEEKGKARIAAEKATQEVEKIKQVTIAEKEKEVAELQAQKEKSVAVTQAEKEKEVATLQKLKEEQLKQATILKAEAKKRELEIADGLSERAKYEIDKKTEATIKSAEALSKWVGPKIVMSGGSDGGQGGSGVEKALMIKMMSDMVADHSK